MKELSKALGSIQANLKAPKDLYNKFGDYRYRSAESILEAVKPLLKEAGLTLVISDQIINVGTRIYVKATVTISNGESNIEVTAMAREAETKKGMDDSQITGAASSYARKYALNGMFLIDDTKDADATNDHGKGPSSKQDAAPEVSAEKIIKSIEAAATPDDLLVIGKKLKNTSHATNQEILEAYKARKMFLSK